jgi:hypothetical protein
MNSTRGSTPPNPSLDLPNHSTGLNKTLVTIGTPHEESIAKLIPPKLVQTRGIEEIPRRTPLTLEHRKTPKLSPSTHGFGRGITAQKTTKGSHNFPPSNPQEQGPENTPRKPPREGSGNHHQEEPGQHNKALRNHADSSIHATKVHTRSSWPPDHPTLSQDLTMKLSS